MSVPDHALVRAVRFVALANLAYFCVELAVARAIGSVSLFADSLRKTDQRVGLGRHVSQLQMAAGLDPVLVAPSCPPVSCSAGLSIGTKPKGLRLLEKAKLQEKPSRRRQ